MFTNVFPLNSLLVPAETHCVPKAAFVLAFCLGGLLVEPARAGDASTVPRSEVGGAHNEAPHAEKAVSRGARQTMSGADEWHELHTQAVSARETSGENPRIRFRLLYHNPTAEEVVVMWGLNDFRKTPSNLPEGTVLNFSKTHMNTPMRRDEGVFVMEYETDMDTRLDYAFSITRTTAGENVKDWRGSQEEGKPYFRAQLAVAATDEPSPSAASLTVPSTVSSAVEAARPKSEARPSPVEEANVAAQPPAPAVQSPPAALVAANPPAQAATGSVTRHRFGGEQSEQWYELHTQAIIPTEGSGEKPRIRFRLRYRNPQASEVVAVWGLNKFQKKATDPPAGTFLTYNDSHMNTPLRKEGDVFVMEYETDADTRLDYAFTITRNAAGKEVQQWHGTGVQGEPYFQAQLTVANANETIAPHKSRRLFAQGRPDEWYELHTQAILPTEGTSEQPRIRLRLRYHNPQVSEVVAVWGLNEFRKRASDLPEGTFLTFNDSHMNTPLRKHGDVFEMEYETDADTRFDYAFNVIRNAAGEEVNQWRGAGQGQPYFQRQLTVAEADEQIGPHQSRRLFSDKQLGEWHELLTQALLPAAGAAKPRIRFQVRYRNPEAAEVVVIWGLNKFQKKATGLPEGTFLTYNDSHMNTPMRKEGDVFVMEYET
ncbi:MAG: hypothetical protein KF861_12985, partial [Planctomycetaceae bacterium]|nr:hypothetical protein [Planctomycetaceae bacterium]